MLNRNSGGNSQDPSNHQFYGNQQPVQPNQFNNKPNPNAEELGNEDRSVKEAIREINRRNIVKFVIIVPLILAVLIIGGWLLWSLIQIAGNEGSEIGHEFSNWFNGNMTL